MEQNKKKESEEKLNKINYKLEIEEFNESKKFGSFILYWAGQQASLLGSSIVSFIIIWWLTIRTQSEIILGTASLLSLGPFILIAPLSGVIADRFNRKSLLISFDAIQAILTVFLSVLFFANYTSVMIILILLGSRGTCQAFQLPISMAITPTMVPAKILSRINGLTYLFNGAINIIGPFIAAILLSIPYINIGMILWIDIGTFVIALITLIIIKIPLVPTNLIEKNQSFINQFLDGFNALRKVNGLIALLFGALIINFFNTPIQAMLPLLVSKIYSGIESDYALVVGMFQSALVIGGLIMSFVKNIKKPVLILMLGIVCMYICQAVIAFIPTNFEARFWIIGLVIFLFALPTAVIDVAFITSIQLLIPKEKLGRVMAAIMAIAPAIRPLGQFLSGIIAEFIGIQMLLIFSSIIGLIIIGFLYRLSPMKLIDEEITRIMKVNNFN